MKAVTWAPRENNELDQLFDSLREQQYQDTNHRLHENYSKNSFAHAGIVAYTIYFDNNNNPELCSSISSRSCWPTGAYRILNRMWKCNNKKQFLRRISDCVGRSAESQIKWLNAHLEPELYFCSRQTNHWDKWTINSFREQFNIIFNTDSFKYLTCPNECDDSCWQTIIYSGNEKLLEEWKRHQ